MRYTSVVAMAVMAASAAMVAAEEKAKELKGSFVRKVEGMELKMVFKKDSNLDFILAQGDVGCTVSAKYTLDKEGVLKCEVTKFEKKGDFPVNKEKGYTFSFKAVMKDKKVVISDFKGDDIDDGAKQALEGDYESSSD